ncbi:peptide chain release factor N(5)-glutamine methyltransferase [Chlorogloeopsis sp. ULAP01]|uniref:peptide chain release factor N(5)-glutamine methyltransferase n=1 Tax=Chlorogloeopsis sp. ULAP01 TaxID=3056483 RepID=UPI0025AA6ECA|nr:peptide chain release factor N(5)-glutamine methyltransferase [Chlorogloeopsis sp. ULAP01]MDM9380696.1 peptide chain release factor N(5)-glutamine methyltransferase [Chlorogloeopsis sp. ULAP01]
MAEKQPKDTSGLQVWQWRTKAIQSAIAADVPPAEVDWLLQEVAGLDSLALRLELFKDWPQIKLRLPLEELEVLWQKRLHERLPVQYITGVTPWRQFKVVVSPAVLIPRPETECLIDLAVATVCKSQENLCLEQGHWADLGTGSGAIALGLADVFRKATIHAVDCSGEALLLAQQNAQNYGFGDRIHFYHGYWWEPLESLKGQFSGMVSNPPYIPTTLVSELQPEVMNHEPKLALDGGIDGLACIRHLIETSYTYLHPGGVWLVEMMAGQADVVREMVQNQGSYGDIEIHTDLAGIERFAVAKKL